MLARLILVLLLALGTTPAVAAPAGCHGMAATAAASDARHTPRGHPVAVDHGCVGCAALGDWLAERVVALPFTPTVRPLTQPAAFAPRAEGPPSLPPPRIG